MFVAASTHCFKDKSFEEACVQLTDLDYDKVEIWMSSQCDHLRPEEVAADPDTFLSNFREQTRLTPIAFCLEEDISAETLTALSRLAKQMRVTQITVPSSEMGTPFNMEVDRLREFVSITNRDSVRLSIKTKTGHLTEDPHTAVELCQAAKGLGISLDPSYYICGPSRGQSYDQVFPYVYHTHLRDTSPEQVQVQIGLGEVDYNRLVSLLERQPYSVALSVDLLPELLDGADRLLEMRKMRRLLETLL